MCIVLAILALILVFYASGELVNWSLVDTLGKASLTENSLIVSQGWDMLFSLWPILLAAMLIGMIIFSLAMKLIPKAETETPE